MEIKWKRPILRLHCNCYISLFHLTWWADYVNVGDTQMQLISVKLLSLMDSFRHFIFDWDNDKPPTKIQYKIDQLLSIQCGWAINLSSIKFHLFWCQRPVQMLLWMMQLMQDARRWFDSHQVQNSLCGFGLWDITIFLWTISLNQISFLVYWADTCVFHSAISPWFLSLFSVPLLVFHFHIL